MTTISYLIRIKYTHYMYTFHLAESEREEIDKGKKERKSESRQTNRYNNEQSSRKLNYPI